MSVPRMLSKKEYDDMGGIDVANHHGFTEHNNFITMVDEFPYYEKGSYVKHEYYVDWYTIKYSKLGQVLE